MRIVVMGLRGFPGIQGGIERHAENLYPRLVQLGCQVEVLSRYPYQPRKVRWRGVDFSPVWSPGESRAGWEAFIHSMLCVLRIVNNRPDILHIHGIGPGAVCPLARMLRIKTVVTHHGQDYNREKWGFWGRSALRMGERLAVSFSTKTIVISNEIANIIRNKYSIESVHIPNGVTIPKLTDERDKIDSIGLKAGKYILNVGRIVPEKRQIDLIKAFCLLKLPDWKLVLAGSLTPNTLYIETVKKMAISNNNIILVGFKTGEFLHQLYRHAGLFVLPSSHEGLPIALLEALSYGLPVLASDIEANREVGLSDEQYFRVGDLDELMNKIRRMSTILHNTARREEIRSLMALRYDWDIIAERTLSVYRECVS